MNANDTPAERANLTRDDLYMHVEANGIRIFCLGEDHLNDILEMLRQNSLILGCIVKGPKDSWLLIKNFKNNTQATHVAGLIIQWMMKYAWNYNERNYYVHGHWFRYHSGK